MPNAFRDIAHALASLTTRCGDFRQAWDEAQSTTGIARCWSGEWRSEENDRHGPMQCVLNITDDEHIEAFFHAEYMKILRVCYQVDLLSERNGNGLKLKGQTDLGRLAGGVYHYSGGLTDTDLVCSYECAYDRGTFQLKPAPPSLKPRAKSAHHRAI